MRKHVLDKITKLRQINDIQITYEEYENINIMNKIMVSATFLLSIEQTSILSHNIKYMKI